MTLVKPVAMYSNSNYSSFNLKSLQKGDLIPANIIQRSSNPLNLTFLRDDGILSMPQTLILGQGAFFHEGIKYECGKTHPFVDVFFPTFSRYTAEHLEEINRYYHITIKVNYFVCFDQLDEPGFVNCAIYADSPRQPTHKLTLNNPPSHLKSSYYNLGQPRNMELELSSFAYDGKFYKKYPTHSHIYMIDTNYSFVKNTLAYKLRCRIARVKSMSSDLHPNLYYQYEIIAHKYRD